jgi:hypothetical protein
MILYEHTCLTGMFAWNTTRRIGRLLSTTHPLIFHHTTTAEEILGVFLATIFGVLIELLAATSACFVSTLTDLEAQGIAGIVEQRTKFGEFTRTVVDGIRRLTLSENAEVLDDHIDLKRRESRSATICNDFYHRYTVDQLR